jgi:hypothetical protein
VRVWFEQFWWVLGGRLRGVEPLGFRLYIRVSFGAALQQIAVCKARGTRDRALQPVVTCVGHLQGKAVRPRSHVGIASSSTTLLDVRPGYCYSRQARILQVSPVYMLGSCAPTREFRANHRIR